MTHTLRDYSVKFGTSGARGLVSELTDAYCWTFTQAFLTVVNSPQRRIIIGHDLRPSSPAITAVCVAAARAMGVECHSAGALPTPAIALGAQSLRLPALMITGSHVPADRNGIKAYRADGEITKADEQAMLSVIVNDPPPMIERVVVEPDMSFTRRYVTRYTEAFSSDTLRGLRVGVYEHSTVARDILHEILRELGADTVSLGRSDAFLPVDTEAIRATDKELALSWALSPGFDAIVSADGDADRPLVGDETGTWMRGDVLGVLCAQALKARSVVTPVSSNTVIERAAMFAEVIRTRIGSPYVIEGMQLKGLPPPIVGYEANGGFLLGSSVTIGGRELSALPTRDACLPIILALSMTRERATTLSQLQRSLPDRFTDSGRLENFPSERSAGLLRQVENDRSEARHIMAPESGAVVGVDNMDGVRVTFENGDIVHLRSSGNAPELRCYVEADSSARAEALCRDCLRRLALN